MIKFGLISLCICVSACANAYPTALTFMPIANILRHREASLYYAATGNERHISKTYVHGFGAQIGLLDRVELGYDTDFLGNNWWNAKVLIVDDPRGMPGFSLSVGSMNYQKGLHDPYVVAGLDLDFARLHAGAIRVSNVKRAMFGVDFSVLGNCTGMIEHVTGPNSFTWASLNVPIPGVEGLALMGSVKFPSVKSDGIQHMVTLSYALRF